MTERSLDSGARRSALLRSIAGYFTPGVVQRAAALVGESPADTHAALTLHVVPALLARMAALGRSDAGMRTLGALVDRVAARENPLADLGRLFGGGPTTQDMLRAGRAQAGELFGGRADAVAAEIAAASRLQHASASSLLALGAPVVLAALGMECGSDRSRLGALLESERAALGGLLTPGLETLTRAVDPGPAPVVEAPPPPARRWPPVALATLVLAGLAVWVASQWRACESVPPVARRGDFQKRLARVALPGGAALDVPEGSFNHELARFLADPNARPPRSFVFEGLFFESGRAALEPASRPTIADLAAILNAFPHAEVRLDGHTDDVGEPYANQRLSLERAESVRAALVAAGVAPERLDALGFGQERPVVANDSEEGRARNRRTELVVTRK